MSASTSDPTMTELAAGAGVSEAEMEKTIAAADAEGAAEGASAEDKMSAAQMMKAMTKAADGDAGIIKESIGNFSTSSIEGVNKKGDVMLEAKDMPGCLAALKKMIEAAKTNKKEKKPEKWAFAASPHELFGKTLDDSFTAFLMWARVAADAEEQEEDDAGLGGKINVSKAFRRLEAYADWMEEAKGDLIDPPLTAASCAPGCKTWGMQMSYSKDDVLCWWVDLAKVDLKAIKGTGEDGTALTVEQSMRAFVWLAHAAMYDPKAQANGMAFMENMAQFGFWASMTMVPMKLSVKLDKLTMGVLPIKMKYMIVADAPRWISVLMKIFGMFMSKKLMGRIKMFKKEWEEVNKIVGDEAIPPGFGECNGKLKGDPVIDPYLAREGLAAVEIG